jgi:hypothetical protein
MRTSYHNMAEESIGNVSLGSTFILKLVAPGGSTTAGLLAWRPVAGDPGAAHPACEPPRRLLSTKNVSQGLDIYLQAA